AAERSSHPAASANSAHRKEPSHRRTQSPAPLSQLQSADSPAEKSPQKRPPAFPHLWRSVLHPWLISNPLAQLSRLLLQHLLVPNQSSSFGGRLRLAHSF